MRAALCILLTACVGLAACGGDSARPAAPAAKATTTPTDLKPPPVERRPLDGGVTTLRIDAGADRLLSYAGFKLEAVGEGKGRERTLTFPVSGGELSVAPAGGRIELAGALRIHRGSRHVDATALRIDVARRVMTATVEGRRIPLLRLTVDYPRAWPSAGKPLRAQGRASVVGDRLVEWLGSGLGAEVLQDGLPLGTIRIVAS